MKQGTQTDIRAGLGNVLNRFGVDVKTARKAREELAERIEGPEVEEEPGQDGDRYFVHFYRHFGLVDLSIEDVLIPTLKPNEQAVYRRLYHLAFNTRPRCNWCQVSVPDLASACNVSEGTVRSGIKGLRESNCIAVIKEASRHEAPVYRVFLPCEIPHIRDIELEDKSQEVGVIFLREEPRHSEFRGLNFRGLVSRPLNSGPLIFGGLNELKSTILRGLNANSRGLDIEGLRDELNGSNGLSPPEEAGDPPLNSLNKSEKISLSPDPIDLFYTGIGQTKISKTKREKGNKVVQELKADGFSLEDIAYAAEWTPKNAKENVYDMEILKHTIGEAIFAKHIEQQAADKVQKEAAGIRAAEEERRHLEGEIKDMRSKLNEEELSDLRKRAKEEIAQTDGIKKEFINEPLVVAKENEILRRKGQ